MELTKEQKYKIYLEEKERLKEEQERDLINSLTEEEKQKIIKEIEANDTVFVTEKDILYPNEKQTKKYTIFFALAVMSMFINIFFGAALLTAIFIYSVYLGVTNRMIMEPNIKYHCPKCDQKHINIIRKEEEHQQQKTGSIRAKCLVCEYQFRLVVGDTAIQKLKIN
ncbi:hypothetical protein [Mesobacillus sp.]|uniref:hypothetical protein n=1 Tax=Mesobacillus sp. TaxID=2675271 RepID=UPI0039EE5705